jgi:NAD-dependent deacetylase
MSQANEEYRTRVETLASYLRRSDRIVFLTGAGMSTESGIPDFRSSTGIYASLRSEEIFDLASFERDPSAFFAFARTFFADMRAAEPNAGHRAIVTLQEEWTKTVSVVTQNIDLLHERAGAETVYALHGTTETCTCLRCGQIRQTEALWPVVAEGKIPRHQGCGGVFKPDIVFFGEMLPESALFGGYLAIQRADLLVVCGTSLAVYPAAGLPSARRSDCWLAVINRTSTPLDPNADLVFREGIGETLSDAIEAMGSPED